MALSQSQTQIAPSHHQTVLTWYGLGCVGAQRRPSARVLGTLTVRRSLYTGWRPDIQRDESSPGTEGAATSTS